MTLSRRDFLKATAGTAAYTLIGDHIAAAAEVNAASSRELLISRMRRHLLLV